MSQAPPPPLPLDLTTKEGRLAKRLRDCMLYPDNPYHPQTTPAQWAALEQDIRDICFAFGLDYASYVASLALYANDNIGIDHENWRTGIQYYLHASTRRPHSVPELRRLDRKYPTTPSLMPRRRGILADLLGY